MGKEKKEKEIGTLIELLNEYETEKFKQGMLEAGMSEEKVSELYPCSIRWSEVVDIDKLKIISKQFGFIKRLVENDKINLEDLQCVFSGNINKRKTLMEETDGYERYEGTEYEATESLIMLLSISDTPIEDLVSYLK